MADLLSGKNMIYQKFTTTFTETFAGGTGSILGGIFFGIPGRDISRYAQFLEQYSRYFLDRLNKISNQKKYPPTISSKKMT
jgi:hypothetical protein